MSTPKRGKPAPKFSEEQLTDLLRIRYAAPEYAFLPKVRNATGYGAVATVRTADALAMGLWKTRGYELHGFEVKVSRSDWLRELRDPAKAEEIGRYCHRWWIVAPKDVVKPGELPSAWGLLVTRGEKQLVATTPAPQLEPDPITYPFLSAILRRLTEDFIEPATARKMVEDAVSQIASRQADLESRDLRNAKRELKSLRSQVAEFERESGLSIRRTWDLKGLGQAVSLLSRTDTADVVTHLDRMTTELRSIADHADGARKALLESIHQPSPPPTDEDTTACGPASSSADVRPKP